MDSVEPTAAEPTNAADQVKTFWRFKRRPVPGRSEKFVVEEFSNSTSTVVILDWNILSREARQAVVVGRHEELSLTAVKSMAPNLAHWSADKELQELLDKCSPSGEADDGDQSNLDVLGRRKHPPVTNFVDNLMAVRLGLTVETIRETLNNPCL